MTTITINQLPAAASASDGDLLVVFQGGTTKKISASVLRDLLAGLSFSGSWDIPATSPGLPPGAAAGDILVVSVAGTYGGNLYEVGDLAIVGADGQTVTRIPGTTMSRAEIEAAISAAQPTTTASRALVSDASGKMTASTATATEVGYLSGVTGPIQTQLAGKEPTIAAGTTAQYYRGDKSWQPLNSAAVGLGNVPNVDATNPANIVQTASYRFVTDTEKAAWNAALTYGDVKDSFQTADHNGWIKLDGRAKSTLNAAQQSRATALGIGTNLPNATNRVAIQNGYAPGTIAGSMSRTLGQNQLPNVTLDTTGAGNHSHQIGMVSSSVGGFAGGWSVSAFKANMAPTNENDTAVTDRGVTQYVTSTLIGDAGSHSHTTASLNGGVTQQSLDVTPASLAVNKFIYLGT